MKNTIRIIAGQFRGRKIHFPDIEGLRPTPDRVRETLFNWLAPVISDANCLDLFAGSGALGFEAISRDAQHVIMIEASFDVTQQLYANRELLKCENLDIIQQEALKYLKETNEKFDIIFLDPPFQSNLLAKSMELIATRQLLNTDGYLYLEMDKSQKLIDLPASFKILKEKIAGQVKYILVLCHS